MKAEHLEAVRDLGYLLMHQIIQAETKLELINPIMEDPQEITFNDAFVLKLKHLHSVEDNIPKTSTIAETFEPLLQFIMTKKQRSQRLIGQKRGSARSIRARSVSNKKPDRREIQAQKMLAKISELVEDLLSRCDNEKICSPLLQPDSFWLSSFLSTFEALQDSEKSLYNQPAFSDQVRPFIIKLQRRNYFPTLKKQEPLNLSQPKRFSYDADVVERGRRVIELLTEQLKRATLAIDHPKLVGEFENQRNRWQQDFFRATSALQHAETQLSLTGIQHLSEPTFVYANYLKLSASPKRYTQVQDFQPQARSIQTDSQVRLNKNAATLIDQSRQSVSLANLPDVHQKSRQSGKRRIYGTQAGHQVGVQVYSQKTILATAYHRSQAENNLLKYFRNLQAKSRVSSKKVQIRQPDQIRLNSSQSKNTFVSRNCSSCGSQKDISPRSKSVSPSRGLSNNSNPSRFRYLQMNWEASLRK